MFPSSVPKGILARENTHLDSGLDDDGCGTIVAVLDDRVAIET